MKKQFFGYLTESPCPNCGTPRVGADWDDDYFIFPGVIKNLPATCFANKIYQWQGFSPKKEDEVCSSCGGKIEWEIEEFREGPRGPYKKMVGVCVNSYQREETERLEGCSKCSSEYHI